MTSTDLNSPRVAAPTLALSRLRWIILGLLFFSTVINYVDRQALTVLLPTLRKELGLSYADHGLITIVFLLCGWPGRGSARLLAGLLDRGRAADCGVRAAGVLDRANRANGGEMKITPW